MYIIEKTFTLLSKYMADFKEGIEAGQLGENNKNKEQSVGKELFDELQALPKMVGDIVEIFKNSGFTNVVSEKKFGAYYVSVNEKDSNGEMNKIEVVISDKTNSQNLRIDPKGEHKEDYYHSAKMIADDKIVQETNDVIVFLKTGNIPPSSSLKRKNTANTYDFTTETELAGKGFDQKIRDKIFAEEGVEEAAKYGKGFRGAEKPKDKSDESKND